MPNTNSGGFTYPPEAYSAPDNLEGWYEVFGGNAEILLGLSPYPVIE